MRLKTGEQNFWCVERIDLFRDLFSILKPEEHEELQKRIRSVKYRRGETIYLPGDPAEMIYFLHWGKVKLAYLDESGRRFALGICKVGQPFGELALLGEERRRLIAEALCDAELCMISKHDLLRLAQRYPQISLKITKMVGDRLREVESKLEDLIFKDVPTRLARLLLRLVHEYGVQTPDGTQIDLRLTHRDLAELIGSTRETTTTTLSRFKAEGVLERRRGRFIVTDPQKLQARSRG